MDVSRRRCRRPDKPMYVPRALRTQNVAGTASSKTTGGVDGIMTSASDDVADESQSVDVNDLSSATISELSSDASDAKLSSKTSDFVRHSAETSRDWRTGHEKTKISCRISGKKVLKSCQKSKPISVTKHRNVVSDTSDSVCESGQPECAANCNVSSTGDDAAVISDHIQVADFLRVSESTYIADSCPQSSAESLCTVVKSTDTSSPDQTEGSCICASSVTSDEVDETVLLLRDVEERRNSPRPVSTVSVVGGELMSGVTRLCVTESDSAIEQQQQHDDTDKRHAVYRCHTVDVDKRSDTDIALAVKVGDLRSRLHDETEADTAMSVGANQSTGNSDTGDAVAEGDDDDDDDDDDGDSWEKMFDDSGTMLHQSDHTEEVIPRYRRTHITQS